MGGSTFNEDSKRSIHCSGCLKRTLVEAFSDLKVNIMHGTLIKCGHR